MKDLYIDAAVAVDGDIYFTTVNTCCLFKYSIENDITEMVVELPVRAYKTRRFVSLVSFATRIWMVPWGEEYFYLYDLQTKEVELFDIPEKDKWPMTYSAFRRAVSHDNYLWAVPNFSDYVLKIDMHDKSYQLIRDWPEGVGTVTGIDRAGCNFKAMCYNTGKIYMFRDRCSKNIVLDADKDILNIWDIEVEAEFGNICNDIVVVAPVKHDLPIRFYEKGTGRLVKKVSAANVKCGDNELYAFWYTDIVNEWAYLLPHDANKMIVVNMNTLEAKAIELDIEGYKTFRRNENYSGAETVTVSNHTVVIPYMGNQMLVMQGDHLEKVIALRVDDDIIGNELAGFIKILLKGKTSWRNKVYI